MKRWLEGWWGVLVFLGLFQISTAFAETPCSEFFPEYPRCYYNHLKDFERNTGYEVKIPSDMSTKMLYRINREFGKIKDDGALQGRVIDSISFGTLAEGYRANVLAKNVFFGTWETDNSKIWPKAEKIKLCISKMATKEQYEELEKSVAEISKHFPYSKVSSDGYASADEISSTVKVIQDLYDTKKVTESFGANELVFAQEFDFYFASRFIDSKASADKVEAFMKRQMFQTKIKDTCNQSCKKVFASSTCTGGSASMFEATCTRKDGGKEYYRGWGPAAYCSDPAQVPHTPEKYSHCGPWKQVVAATCYCVL